ncbi:MAG: PQQ-binding-like beta-propeller repeat protein, partial [Pirellulaceae bacterium]
MNSTSTSDASQSSVETQSTDFSADAVSSAERCSPWLLFAMPVGLGMFLGMVVTAMNVIRSIDAKAFYLGLDGLRPVILFAFVGLTALVFGLCCFRPKLKSLTLGIAGAVAIGAFCFNCIRVESFYGNMIPKLTWSWKPTIEEEVDAFFVSRELKESETLLMTEVDEGLFASSERDFLGLLGNARTGVLEDCGLANDWETQAPELLWEHPVGLGWSSFAVVGQAAITLEQRGELECVVCYNLLTGTEIWVYGSVRRFYDEHGDGPRSTPTIAGSKVYTMGADGLLCCLELSNGELVWSQDVLRDMNADNLLWGMSGCPLVFDNKVVVTPGGKAAAAVCFDATTGDELWRTGGDLGAYSSPTLATLCGTQQLLSFNGTGLRAFDTNGQPTWLVP